MQTGIVIIVNSLSRQLRYLEQQLSQLDNGKCTYALYKTSPETDAVSLAKKALLNQCELIVIVGGDGTVNEVTNGIADANCNTIANVTLAIMPLGSGNDLQRSLAAPVTLKEIIANYNSAKTKEVDIGKVSFWDPQGNKKERFFVNACNIGMGGEVSRIVNRRSKRLGAAWAYHSAIIQALARYENSTVNLSYDQQHWHGAIKNITIANGNYIGHGLCVAPEARLDSGRFALVRMGDIGLIDYLANVGKLKRGKKLDHPEVDYSVSDHCVIRGTSIQLPVEVDGEFVGLTPVEITILPKAIHFVSV